MKKSNKVLGGMVAISWGLFALVSLSGCSTHQKTEIVGDQFHTQGTPSFSGSTVSTLEYEGCEYIMIGAGDGKTLSHKGNCKSCREFITNSRPR